MPDAAKVIAELRDLDARSGGQRVAWTETWWREREALAAELEALPEVVVDYDAAGNLWARRAGELAETIAVGSHLDCVPGGGWLDGALGVLAGVELIRQVAAGARPRRSFALVDWADEEGARFGRSLLGSSAAAGLLTREEIEDLRDSDGDELAPTLRAFDVEVDQMLRPSPRLRELSAYLELHIEQGPVLESQGRCCAAVNGALGIRRSRIEITGVAAHAATPMAMRADPGVAAARFVVACREAALKHDGVATVGSLTLTPGVPTVIPERCELTVDVRHASHEGLTAMEQELLAAARQSAEMEGCRLELEPLMSSDPVAFDHGLVTRIGEVLGDDQPLVSGPLHDAVSMARAGLPAAMIFVRSRGGISHSRDEDSSEEDLVAAFDVFAEVVEQLLQA